LEHDPFAIPGASLSTVAEALGVDVVEQAGELPNHWLVRTEKPRFTTRDKDSDRVLDRFQHLHSRAKLERETHPLPRSADLHASAIVSALKYLSRRLELRQRIKRAPPPPVQSHNESLAQRVATRLGILDPRFPEQWHLVNNDYPEHMMNVTPLWDMGLTGKGIISSLVDDGLDYTSVDLKDNFDADNSYDFNDHESLPTPKKFDDHHGTRCAGQVAAGKNAACGVGIAYQSKVAGVRILSGPISDVDEAAALNYGFQNVSIYSCSWGPPDNGMSMEGPGYLIEKAVVNGINNGRGGKGSIFVFASGNGAASGDQCNFDGYTNSIYSVTVSAVDYKGLHPYYSEPCAANMVVAYSSGSGKHIVTTDKGQNECTTSHGGTSAAAPNAVGVFALALEARPELTWRDVQYLCVENARMINPDDPDWELTAVGRPYSYKYGFGVLDAHKYVTAAQAWTLVKPQAWIQTKPVQLEGGTMDNNHHYSGGRFIGHEGVTSTISVTKQMLVDNNFETLEHVNIKVWINHTVRGDVEVEIVSPGGIKSILAKRRQADTAKTGFPGWTFMSVKHWGEDPIGDWTIKVSDQNNTQLSNGTFLGWNMKFWGSSIDPSKATKYEVPAADDDLLPPHVPPVVDPPTTTKVLTKPTAHLPGDHGEAEGENTNPAFSTIPSSAVPTAGIPSPEEVGWFPKMSNLVSSQKWFFVALGAVALFGIGATVYFWKRRRARLASYTHLPANEEVSMSALAGRRRSAPRRGPRPTKELYDAFGEVSDDEYDGDEEEKLLQSAQISAGLGFHSEFLDDDEIQLDGARVYRDDPDGTQRFHGKKGSPSPTVSPSGSGGSWEHA